MVTDVQRELAEIEEALLAADHGPDESAAAAAVTRVVHLHVRRAALTGRPDDQDRALVEVDAALARMGHWSDLCLLAADLLVRVHELDRAMAMLQTAPATAQSRPGRAVRADIELQSGRPDVADELAQSLVDEERTWDHLARLAHLATCRGDLGRADVLYVEAEDEITAKSMRAYAWVELERARLALPAGDVERAGAHVERADRAYTGHWRTHEVRAGLFAAQGRIDEAISEQDQVLELTGRPEAHQALATLHRRGDRAQAARVHDDATHSAFLGSALRGEARYLHHLVELYAARPRDIDMSEAVRWARRDARLRPNHLTRGTLAWALSRAGRYEEARDEMCRALAYGLRDPRLMPRAAEVFGSTDEKAWPATVGAAAPVASTSQ
jgi:tetratricopeptide (TPR) repeat protein